MTIEELQQIVTLNTHAIAQLERAIAELEKTVSAHSTSIERLNQREVAEWLDRQTRAHKYEREIEAKAKKIKQSRQKPAVR